MREKMLFKGIFLTAFFTAFQVALPLFTVEI